MLLTLWKWGSDRRTTAVNMQLGASNNFFINNKLHHTVVGLMFVITLISTIYHIVFINLFIMQRWFLSVPLCQGRLRFLKFAVHMKQRAHAKTKYASLWKALLLWGLKLRNGSITLTPMNFTPITYVSNITKLCETKQYMLFYSWSPRVILI